MLLITILIAVFLLVIAYSFLRFIDKGFLVSRCFPLVPMGTGDKVHLYINQKYNRTATISSVNNDFIYIYDKLPLNIDFRGRFYASGRLQDGKRLLIVSHYKYAYLAALAELLRKIFDAPECVENLPVSFANTGEGKEE